MISSTRTVCLTWYLLIFSSSRTKSQYIGPSIVPGMGDATTSNSTAGFEMALNNPQGTAKQEEQNTPEMGYKQFDDLQSLESPSPSLQEIVPNEAEARDRKDYEETELKKGLEFLLQDHLQPTNNRTCLKHYQLCAPKEQKVTVPCCTGMVCVMTTFAPVCLYQDANAWNWKVSPEKRD